MRFEEKLENQLDIRICSKTLFWREGGGGQRRQQQQQQQQQENSEGDERK
jgi:hypothetical protein